MLKSIFNKVLHKVPKRDVCNSFYKVFTPSPLGRQIICDFILETARWALSKKNANWRSTDYFA
jgi:hypothetical protein